jgi:hypothetical protein
MKNLSIDEIREIVEVALDRPLESFSMVVEVQKRYNVRIPEERMPNVRTGDQLKGIIVELTAAATEGALP